MVNTMLSTLLIVNIRVNTVSFVVGMDANSSPYITPKNVSCIPWSASYWVDVKDLD